LHAGSATAWLARQKDCSPGFVLFAGQRPCGKEASLLKAFLVTFGAPKVTKPPRL